MLFIEKLRYKKVGRNHFNLQLTPQNTGCAVFFKFFAKTVTKTVNTLPLSEKGTKLKI
jgi:hypothetical protein